MGSFASTHIVTDGLIVAIDPANTKSYPGSGTIVTDMKELLIGTFTGGGVLTHETDYRGVWRLVPNNTDLGQINLGIVSQLGDLPQFSVDVWYKSIGIGVGQDHCGIFSLSYASAFEVRGNGDLWYFTNEGSEVVQTIISDKNYLDSMWHHAVCVTDTDNNYLYIDGVLKGSNSNNWTGIWNWPTNNMIIGYDINVGASRKMYGDIGPFKLYNRTLSIDEIAQNYNAHKSRYI
jgi:hypothetical protein